MDTHNISMPSDREPIDPEILLTHGDFVRELARRILIDSSAADDVTQDAYVKACERPPKSKIRAWFYTVTRNLAFDRIRRARTRRDREVRAVRSESVPSAADVYEREGARRRIVDAVLSLNEPYKSVILLRFFEDLQPREAARRLNIPIETFRTQQKRAMQQLRARLDSEFGGRGNVYSILIPLAGTIVMKTSTKSAVAAILLLFAFGILWFAMPPLRSESATTPSNAVELATARSPINGEVQRAESTNSAAAGDESQKRTVTSEIVQAPIRGQVINIEGKPVAGARILCYPADLERPVDPEKDNIPGNGILFTNSDASGNFAFHLDGRAALYSLFADAENYSPTGFEVMRPGKSVIIKLFPDCPLEGQVFDYDKKPVAGASVTWRAVISNVQVGKQFITDVNGRYRISGVPSVEGLQSVHIYHYFVSVEAEGYARLLQRAPLAKQSTEKSCHLDLYLSRGATLAIRVVDAETEATISGAKVVVWSQEINDNLTGFFKRSVKNPLDDPVLFEGTTNAEGSINCERLPTWGVHWRRNRNANPFESTLGYAAATAPRYMRGISEVLVPDEGETARLEIRCWPLATITGRIVDHNKKPVPHARVYVDVKGAGDGFVLNGLPGRSDIPSTGDVTDDNGYYSFSVPARFAKVLDAKVEAYYSADQSGRTDANIMITVRAGETTAVPDLVLKPKETHRANVQVLDPAGKPVWGAVIDKRDWDDDTSRYVTDRNGRACVWYAPNAETGRVDSKYVNIRVEGFAVAVTPEFTPSTDDPPEIIVKLQIEHTAGGKVIFADGTPAKNITLRIARSSIALDDLLREEEPGRAPLPPLAWLADANSADDGSFEFTNLPEGSYQIVAWAPRTGGGETPYVTASVSGVASDSHDTILTFAPEATPNKIDINKDNGEIIITIREESSGKPVIRCDVSIANLENRGRRIYGSRPVSPGVFKYGGLSPGKWIVNVTTPGAQAAEREVEIPAGAPPVQCELSIQKGIRCGGVIRTSAGTPLRNAKIFLTGTSGSASGVSDASGYYSMTGLRANTHYRPTVVESETANPNFTWWAPASSQQIRFDINETEATRDVIVTRAGGLVARIRCARLPVGSWDTNADAAKWNCSKASKVSVFDRSGTLVYTCAPVDQRGFERVVPVGDYVVRVEIEGAPPQEKTATVKTNPVSTTLQFEIQ